MRLTSSSLMIGARAAALAEPMELVEVLGSVDAAAEELVRVDPDIAGPVAA
jgi:hypothetical protein